MKLQRLLILPVLLIATSVAAKSKDGDLETWVSRDLVPYVEEQLRSLPRFRNESFRFVIMADDSPQSEGNALVIGIRDRLRDSMAEVPGIRIAWQGDQPGVGLAAGSSPLDCTKNEANYLVGIELRETNGGEVNIRVRALDIEERAWVPGFTRAWQGPLTRQQFRDLRRTIDDPTYRGERDAPWSDVESDLMAAHLAYELGCKLLRQTSGEYIVALNEENGEVDRTTALVELVGNNLAGIRALQFGTGDANAVIDGKAHRIDDDLYQYWVTITPTDSTSDMTPLSADAYIRIVDEFQAASLVPENVFDLPQVGESFLSGFGVVRLGHTRACFDDQVIFSDASSTQRLNGECFALEAGTADDAVVFFLNHQLNYGLVRLSNSACSRRSLARIGRAGSKVRLPLPLDTLQSGDWSEADGWSTSPRVDSYYTIAATDTGAARALSRHIELLPPRCSASIRPGLEGDDLKRWLQELAAIQEHWAPAIAWRSIRVKDVY